MSLRLFADVSAVVEREGGGVFDAIIDPEWTIAGRPNGGYLMSIMGRAAAGVVAQPDVIAASATYLRPPDVGPVELRTAVLRAGRSASQVRVRLVQDAADCVEALFTVATLDPLSAPFWAGGLPAREPRAFDECVRIPSTGPTGLHIPIMDQVELRMDPDDLGFARGRPSGRGELNGWLALPQAAVFDPLSLLYAVDAFPPATFEVQTTGWVPTLELTAYVRALPAPGPVRVLQKAQLVQEQRVDEVCYVWDGTGRLVAQGTQLAAIRLG